MSGPLLKVSERLYTLSTMSEPILEQLFDSPVRVRLLKFFVYNGEGMFAVADIAKRIQAEPRLARRELERLARVGFIKTKRSRETLYQTNAGFAFFNELKTLVTKSSPTSKERMLERLQRLGRLKLVVLSGIFIDLMNAKADLLIVGDGIREGKMNAFFRDLEAEVGKELDYVVLSSEDFQYRYNMYDRFVRDILERPHEKLINKLGL